MVKNFFLLLLLLHMQVYRSCCPVSLTGHSHDLKGSDAEIAQLGETEALKVAGSILACGAGASLVSGPAAHLFSLLCKSL